jgi:hypothetical protein
VWHLAARPGWYWAPYNAQSRVDRGSAQPGPIQLKPGINSIIIAIRERGTALDRIYLSESPNVPQ